MVGSGIETVGGGLAVAGATIGSGIGSAIGGVANMAGDVVYNMAARAFYDSGYIQAATTIAVVLIFIDLRKNKII